MERCAIIVNAGPMVFDKTDLQGPNDVGLICLVKDYLETLEVDEDSRDRISEYLAFVKARSNGMSALFWVITKLTLECRNSHHGCNLDPKFRALSSRIQIRLSREPRHKL